MKNNKLHIQYNGTGIKSNDYIESFYCKKLERAEEIVRQVNRDVIKKAVFKDINGTIHNII